MRKIDKKYRVFFASAVFLCAAFPSYAQILPAVEPSTEHTTEDAKLPSSATPLITDANATQPATQAKSPSASKSLFFSSDEIESISSAQEAFRNKKSGVDEGDFLANLEALNRSKAAEDAAGFTYPQFFLASIAYHSKGDWVVWINDEKITQNSAVSNSGLRVVELDKGKAVFEWLPTRMDKITDTDSFSNSNPVKVDLINNKVSFTLKPNQTFTSYSMRVVEGKPKPVIISPSVPQ